MDEGKMRPEAAAAASNLKPASSVPAVRSVSNRAQPDLALHRPRLGRKSLGHARWILWLGSERVWSRIKIGGGKLDLACL